MQKKILRIITNIGIIDQQLDDLFTLLEVFVLHDLLEQSVQFLFDLDVFVAALPETEGVQVAAGFLYHFINKRVIGMGVGCTLRIGKLFNLVFIYFINWEWSGLEYVYSYWW
jgi:hypothetical protein